MCVFCSVATQSPSPPTKAVSILARVADEDARAKVSEAHDRAVNEALTSR